MKLFDPIELEIFKKAFVSIAEEMGAVLGRTAVSPNIKERRDFSCALFNSMGETFSQGTHIPVHLGAMPLSVQAAISSIKFEDGDTVILNDPYRGGTHLPDITCITPVFLKGELRFFVANRAHHSDVGGMTPGSMPLATEIFQEGLIIPPVKIISKGNVNNEAIKLLLANVRTPEERRGDLLAQLAANDTGKKRLLEIIGKYGIDRIESYTRLIQDYCEKVLRYTLKGIPDGSYTFSDYMDDDGIADDPVKIAVTLTIKGDQVTIDFTGSSPQTAGGINANFAVTCSAVLYVFRALIEEDIPINTGLMKPLKIIAPIGTIINALFPSATAGGNVETSQRIVDVLLGALSKAIPRKIPAASQGTMNNIAFGGFNPSSNENFAYYETIGGGAGAGKEIRGADAIHTHMTNSLNTPIEAIERYLPVRINNYSIRRNSGGIGKYSGGNGITREYEFLVPANLTIISERRKTVPYGLQGGTNGKAGSNILVHDGKKIRLSSKTNIKVNTGDRVIISTPGGGGYGKK